MSLEDTLWNILDTVHLGDFFEDHNIPPIVLPLVIITIIILAAFLVLSTPSDLDTTICGDGICKVNEDATNCPEDCGPVSGDTTYSLIVAISGASCNVYHISLTDKSKKTIGKPITTTNTKYNFRDLTSNEVYVSVSSPQSSKKPFESNLIDLADESVVSIRLPLDYCGGTIGIPEIVEGTTKGSLQITVLDSSTNKPISAKVTLFDTGSTEIASRHIINSDTFTQLDGDKYYYLTASMTGYQDYDGSGDLIYVPAGTKQKETIELDKSTIPLEATGTLRVCVFDTEDQIIGGDITIFDVRKQAVKVGNLDSGSIFSGPESEEGCYSFTLPAGHLYYAQVTRAASGCAEKPMAGPIMVDENSVEKIIINLHCSDVGEIRAVVYGDTEKSITLTGDCSVELYYENGTKIRTMHMDDEEYTRYYSVPSDEVIYVHAKNVPTGYKSTLSEVITIEGGEQETAEIVLTPAPIVNYGKCTQPVKFKVGGVANLLKLGGEYEGGIAYGNIEYDGPTNGPYTLTDVEIPGITEKVIGPTNKVESSVMTLEVDSTTGILSATVKCNLICGVRGDLDGDGVVGEDDEEILRTILDAVEILGEPPYGNEAFEDWPPVCLDINEDGLLTEDDYTCLIQNFDNCQSCQNTVAAAGRAYTVEVCGDGYDNDCDGQMDSLVKEGEDLCDCTENTPCELKRDTIGLGAFDPDLADTCALLGFKDSEGYKWYSPAEWVCTGDRAGETLNCGGNTLYCVEEGEDWLWSEDGSPIEPLTFQCPGCLICDGTKVIYKYTCTGTDCSEIEKRSVDCDVVSDISTSHTTPLGTSASCLSGGKMGYAQKVTFKSTNEAQVGMELFCVDFSDGTLDSIWTATENKGVFDCGPSGHLVGIDCRGDCSETETNDVTCAIITPTEGPGPGVTCVDNDGGGSDQYVIASLVTTYSNGIGSETHSDYCVGDVLYEGICVGGVFDNPPYNCPNGCDNGACKTGPEPGDCDTLDSVTVTSTPVSGCNSIVTLCGRNIDLVDVKKVAQCDGQWEVTNICSTASSPWASSCDGGWTELIDQGSNDPCTSGCDNEDGGSKPPEQPQGEDPYCTVSATSSGKSVSVTVNGYNIQGTIQAGFKMYYNDGSAEERIGCIVSSGSCSVSDTHTYSASGTHTISATSYGCPANDFSCSTSVNVI